MNKTLADVLQMESAAVEGLFAGEGWFRLGLILAVAIGASVVIRAGLEVARRSGYDDRGRLSSASLIANSLVAVWALIALTRFWFGVAPTLTLTVVSVGLAAVVFLLAGRLQGIAAGLTLTVRGHLREGDTLEVGDVVGQIERVGLLQLRLRALDGARIILPTRRLAGADLLIRSPQRASPVTVLHRLEAPWTTERRETAFRLANLCPYRAEGTEVKVVVDPADPLVAHVTIGAWTASASGTAEDWLNRALERSVHL